MHKAKPIEQEFRLGLIKATVKVRRARGRQRYSISVSRLFRNGKHWKQSAVFGPEDIPVMRLVLDKAYGWILLEQQEMEELPDELASK